MVVLDMFGKLKAKLPPMPTTPPTHEPNRSALLQLALLVGFATILHFKIADIRVAIFALLVFIVKAVIVVRKLPHPPKLVLIFLTIVSVGLIIYVYKGWSGQRAGISFLVLLGALKFLESESLRDYYISCLLLYFLAASTFLFDSSVLSIVIVVLYTIGLTSILLQITNPQKIDLKHSLGTSTGIILKALPLAIILFFFFPRIQGSFGFFPSTDQQSVNELSDALVAGEMALSAFNNSLAFRVEFKDGKYPPRSQLYWRSKTMARELTFQWELVKPTGLRSEPHTTLQDNASLENGEWTYQILHEPSEDKFLPYLDYVAGYDKGLVLDDYSVFNFRPEQRAFSYKGSSTTIPSLNDGEQIDRVKYLQTQSRPNAKIQALLEGWKSTSRTDEELVLQVYQYLLDNPFYYSLTPPALDEFDPLGDFLLNTQTGYCEHYASAFTILMRWLRVPARIVVGYQGGTMVNGNQFMEVRYSDAHAWSEVWINNRWSRVDPTAAISPDRIEFGMDALMELWGTEYFNSGNSGLALNDYLNPTGASRVLKTLTDSWKNVGYKWNKWVVNYDFDAQKELLSNLGFKHKNSVLVLVLIMAVSAISLMLFYFWQLIPKSIKRTDIQRSYLKFTAKFKKLGLEKLPAETPLEFSRRAIASTPHQSQSIQEVTTIYYRLRYAKISEKIDDEIKHFKKITQQFRLNSKNQKK